MFICNNIASRGLHAKQCDRIIFEFYSPCLESNQESKFVNITIAVTALNYLIKKLN